MNPKYNSKQHFKSVADRIVKLLFILLFFAVSSCSKDEVVPLTKDDNVLVSSELISTQTASNLRILLSFGGINIDLSSLQYDVDIYKVSYNTAYKNETIVASGLVLIPKTTDEVSMLSFQHGTIAANKDAPTRLNSNDPSLLLYTGVSSHGFIGVVPDFIGFGSSSNIMHPYYVESLTASCIIDNLKAAQELAIEKSNNFNGDLFLAGYSEGGYATMATHKSIEQNGLDDFNLIASFPAAGGYDVKEMQEYLFGLDTYDNPFFIAYVAQAYKITFDFSQPLSEFFREPYASGIPDFFDGTMTGSQINAKLTSDIVNLITPNLKTNINTNADYAYFREAFIENSLVDWAPTVKMFLYHGETDTIVPFKNSEITFNKLIANGASSDILKFISIKDGNHSTAFIPYIEDIIPKILSLK